MSGSGEKISGFQSLFRQFVDFCSHVSYVYGRSALSLLNFSAGNRLEDIVAGVLGLSSRAGVVVCVA